MPLNAAVLGIAPGLPEAGDTKGPRGNTVHGLVNLIGVIGNTPVFDSAAWTAEMNWNNYTHVRRGETLFHAKGYASSAVKDKWDGDRKRDGWGKRVSVRVELGGSRI